MILQGPTQTVQVVLAGAKTSLDCPVLASFVDAPLTTSSIATAAPGVQPSTTNGTTAVTVVAAPGANYRRTITEFTLTNIDTGAVTATVQFVDSAGATTKLYTVTLQIGDNLEWIAGYGFSVTDSTGALKTPSASAPFSISPTRGIGYGAGAGGAVTQASSRSTGVTLSKVAGQITTNTTSLAAAAQATFTVTNTTVAATDTVVVSIASGQTNKETKAYVSAVAAGSFDITVHNQHASTAEVGAAIINFAVLKAVAA